MEDKILNIGKIFLEHATTTVSAIYTTLINSSNDHAF